MEKTDLGYNHGYVDDDGLCAICDEKNEMHYLHNLRRMENGESLSRIKEDLESSIPRLFGDDSSPREIR